MKIFVIGAGQVGATIVQALHDEHELTVFDLDEERLAAVSQRYDVHTVEGNGASRRVLSSAGIANADLLIACTSRDESNIVAAMISKACSRRTTTIVRTTNPEYLEVWREGQLDVDFIVSSEIETAHAILRTVGVPSARQTDVFADGQVQLVEFDVTDSADAGILGRPLRDVDTPPDSRLAAIIRGDEVVIPRGAETIEPGDRIVVIGSPHAAQAWGTLISPGTGKVRDVVVFGAGRAGTAVARLLLEQGDVLEVERRVARRLRDALRDLRRASPAGDELVAVRETASDLISHHRARPGARTDEAHVAAHDVPELRELIQVPGLQHAAARPGEVRLVGLVQARMRARRHLVEDGEPERPELEEVELAAARDPPLAIEQRPAIGASEEHVGGHGDEDDREHRSEQHEQHRRDDLVENQLRGRVSGHHARFSSARR